MARVTVEDCIPKVINRFELVWLASQRARMISSGIKPNVDGEDDKDTVISLREIAAGAIDVATLRAVLIKNLRGKRTDYTDDEPQLAADAHDIQEEFDYIHDTSLESYVDDSEVSDDSEI